MKLVIAIIQATKLSAVRQALEKIEVGRLTVCDAQGFANEYDSTEHFRQRKYTTNLRRKIALEVVVNDDFLDRTIDTILHVARTGPEGALGDGRIFVLPSEETVEIVNGVRGPGAV